MNFTLIHLMYKIHSTITEVKNIIIQIRWTWIKMDYLFTCWISTFGLFSICQRSMNPSHQLLFHLYPPRDILKWLRSVETHLLFANFGWITNKIPIHFLETLIYSNSGQTPQDHYNQLNHDRYTRIEVS